MEQQPQTQAEAKLWEKLQTFGGFVPQGKTHGFTPDFWNKKLKLAIEVDGGVHKFKKDWDAWREATLRDNGVFVLRFTNERVLNDMDGCIQEILAAVTRLKRRKSKQNVLRVPRFKMK